MHTHAATGFKLERSKKKEGEDEDDWKTDKENQEDSDESIYQILWPVFNHYLDDRRNFFSHTFLFSPCETERNK